MARTLRQRLQDDIEQARRLAAEGRRPSDLAGDPMAAHLALNRLIQRPDQRREAIGEIAAFEAAWGIDTPDARELTRRRQRETEMQARARAEMRSRYAAASPEDRARVDHYSTLTGPARKRFRDSHRAQLRRAGGIS